MKCSIFALVDCNNFYVSCERAFNPSLRNRPVAVLSNNDGCIVARSPEVKALGIEMGVPRFTVQQLIQKHDIQLFSSNYALYGDMSRRVMETLSSFSPAVEVYSIDEAFLGFSGSESSDLAGYGCHLRATVRQWTGIPISIGFAPTKTLAKVANRLAKQQEGGVYVLHRSDLDAVLEEIAVADIWGIGRRLSRWCYLHHIHNALQLKEANPGLIRQKMGVVGLRLQRELAGESCLPLDCFPQPKQETCVSRSFGQPVTRWQDLKEAVASFTAKAAEKLRRQGQVASSLQVFVRTSPFQENYYGNSITRALPTPTNYTPELIRHAVLGLQSIFREGRAYKKAGVLMLELVSAEYRQLDLFEPPPDFSKEAAHMEAVDLLNRQLGSDVLQWAGAGLDKPWQVRQRQRSPRYTTCWAELPAARAR